MPKGKRSGTISKAGGVRSFTKPMGSHRHNHLFMFPFQSDDDPNEGYA